MEEYQSLYLRMRVNEVVSHHRAIAATSTSLPFMYRHAIGTMQSFSTLLDNSSQESVVASFITKTKATECCNYLIL